MNIMTPAPLEDEDQDLDLLSNNSDLFSFSTHSFQSNQEGGLSRSLTHQEQLEERLLANLDRLKFFLATAPSACPAALLFRI
jgi:hypothetical protein